MDETLAVSTVVKSDVASVGRLDCAKVASMDYLKDISSVAE